MVSTPDAYIRMVLSPSLRRFADEPTALDLAFAVCILTSHIADVVHETTGESRTKIRSDLANKNAHFPVVDAVANASKHVELKDKRHGVYRGLRIDDAQVGASAPFSSGSYWSGGASWKGMPRVVRICSPDGQWHDLLLVARSVVKTLEAEYC